MRVYLGLHCWCLKTWARHAYQFRSSMSCGLLSSLVVWNIVAHYVTRKCERWPLHVQHTLSVPCVRVHIKATELVGLLFAKSLRIVWVVRTHRGLPLSGSAKKFAQSVRMVLWERKIRLCTIAFHHLSSSAWMMNRGVCSFFLFLYLICCELVRPTNEWWRALRVLATLFSSFRWSCRERRRERRWWDEQRQEDGQQIRRSRRPTHPDTTKQERAKKVRRR